MDRDSANAARLRINRISIIQQIDTQELIPKLIDAHIISAENDIEYINHGTSKIDRARRLLDCLLDREHNDRPANWFLLFRTILLENPSVYQNLVKTIDNTKIPRPDMNLANSEIYNEKEQITNIEFDPYITNKIIIQGSFEKVMDNLTYYSQVCLTD